MVAASHSQSIGLLLLHRALDSVPQCALHGSDISDILRELERVARSRMVRSRQRPVQRNVLLEDERTQSHCAERRQGALGMVRPAYGNVERSRHRGYRTEVASVGTCGIGGHAMENRQIGLASYDRCGSRYLVQVGETR